jgi:voltage-gated potassium channel
VKLIHRFTNSWKALIFSYLVLLFGCSLLYDRFEGKSFADSIWWAIVTASTVGYGDSYPNTWQGRVMAGVLISAMIFFVLPLITAHFASKLIVDNDAFKHDEQEEIKNNLREIRATVARLEQSLRRDGREDLLAELSEVEARVGKDLRGQSLALPDQAQQQVL